MFSREGKEFLHESHFRKSVYIEAVSLVVTQSISVTGLQNNPVTVFNSATQVPTSEAQH
jgi:propanediol dehydratase large subunit